jgi:hypothetical protein
MANIVFNVAKGAVAELARRVDGNDPTNSAFIQVLLTTVEADATLRDYDTLSAILTAGGGTANVEATFTNYARNVLDQDDIAAPTVDDTNDRVDVDVPDWVIATAGNGTNNSLVKLLICYDSDTTGGTDANIIPLTAHDISVTTNGQQLTVAPVTAQVFFRAS